MNTERVIQLPARFENKLLSEIGRASLVITSDGIVIKDRREILDGPVPRPATVIERASATDVTT